MAVESKPIFHPEVMRQQVRSFNLPEQVAAWEAKLQHWASFIGSGRADEFKETALLPDFLTDIFCGLLGYTGPAGVPPLGAPASLPAFFGPRVPARMPALPVSRGQSLDAPPYTLSRERHVEVDGEFADAVLGHFQKGKEQFIAVLEGKGTRDPLDRPFAGRRMSAVDQAYRYAINLPCDWIIVTSMRETRLYYKGAHQQTYERFETVRLAADEALVKRFIFLLGTERVVPAHRECHLYELLRASETVGRELTNQFYALYVAPMFASFPLEGLQRAITNSLDCGTRGPKIRRCNANSCTSGTTARTKRRSPTTGRTLDRTRATQFQLLRLSRQSPTPFRCAKNSATSRRLWWMPSTDSIPPSTPRRLRTPTGLPQVKWQRAPPSNAHPAPAPVQLQFAEHSPLWPRAHAKPLRPTFLNGTTKSQCAASGIHRRRSTSPNSFTPG
jgi:hypothetical protein